MAFNLAEYEPVADRIERFWKDHPEGKILTDLVYHDEKSFIVKASVWRNSPIAYVTKTVDQTFDRIIATPDTSGFAEELVGSTNVNKTSALENCETSAIGRALANLGYAPKGQRPSREEMVKVASRGDTERIIDDARNQTDRAKECPECGSGLYDNRDKNRERSLVEGKNPLPAFKCTNRRCTGANGEPWIAWGADYFDDIELMVDKGTGEIFDPPEMRSEYDDGDAPF